MKSSIIIIGILLTGAAMVVSGCGGQEGPDAASEAGVRSGRDVSPSEEASSSAELRPQEFCPVMGGGINLDLYADHDGKRVYFCCEGCSEAFEKNPEKYIESLKKTGQFPIDIPKAN